MPDGRLVVAGQRQILAGASRPIGAGVANAMRFAGLDLNTAVRMAVHQPAALLGVEPGGLEPGDPGDLVQFDLVEPPDENAPPRFEVRATLIDGQVVWGTPRHPV